MNIGIQLYSAKARIGEIGLDAVLTELSEMGVDTVETAEFYDLSPKELGEELDVEPRGGLLHAVVSKGYSKCRESIAAARALGVDTFILEVESNIGEYDFIDYVERSINNMKKFAREA